MAYQDVDEFGIPKKSTPSVDEFGIPVKKKLSGTSSSVGTLEPPTGLESIPSVTDLSKPQDPYIGITDPNLRHKLRENDAHYAATKVAEKMKQSVGTLPPKNPLDPPKPERGIMDEVSQAMYLPAFNEGFNDLVVKPAAGATDFIDRTIDKVYSSITGDKTPDWLRKKGAFDDLSKYYEDQYQERDKPTNVVSDVVESTVGTMPLIASLFTGEGEASIATKLPNLFSKTAKIMGATNALSAYKDATDKGKDMNESLAAAEKGGAEGVEKGLVLDAQMLVGGALGKGVVGKLAEKGLLKGGKAGEALIHAIATGTVFSGSSAGNDLLNGKDIDTKEAMKQMGMGFAFEIIPVAKAFHDEMVERGEDKKIDESAAKAGVATAAASNMNAESMMRTLMNTPAERLQAINDNVSIHHEDLYAQSLENGMKAYEATDPNEKRTFYGNQLLLKAQGDVKNISSKLADPELKQSLVDDVVNSDELTDDHKAELLQKLDILTPEPNEQIEPLVQDVPVTEQKPAEQNEEKPVNKVDDQPENKVDESKAEVSEPPKTPEDVAAEEPKAESIKEEKPVEAPEKAEKEGDQTKQKKKKILTERAYEGDISPEVKKHLEEKGLTRSSFSQEQRSSQATEFIKKFGDDAAKIAVDKGDVEGGLASSILAQLQIKNNQVMSGLDSESQEYKELAKKNADLIEMAERKGYQSGEFVGQLAYEYQNTELNYANIKRQVERSTGKPASDHQEKKIKQLSDENEKLKSQLSDSESKLIDETDKAFNQGKEAAKDETKAQKAKRIADKIRKGKLSRPGVFSAATPASLVWDTAVETVAKTVEAGGKLADAIDAGIKQIKDSDWYKGLSDKKKSEAEYEFKKHHQNNSGSTDLEDLQERFLDKKGNKFTSEEAKDLWGYMKERYISNGVSFRDAISNTSQDLGLSWRQVNEAITTPKTKRVSDDMWKRQYDYNRYRIGAKSWIDEQNLTAAGKALKHVSGIFRGVAVFGHGGIFVGTHAGMNLFNPSTWNKTIPAFINGWKFAYGNEGNFQRAMEDLKNSPNYVTAQRAGLKNDPDRINAEEYQRSQKYLGKLGQAGEKGFNAIKVLRQGIFDHYYNKLTATEQQDPAVAKSIAHIVNLATGATDLKIPTWVNEVSFAGGMEAARWEKLTASPVIATRTALKALVTPEKATTSEKVFAKVWAKRVGIQLATLTGTLLANSALQNMINPKNPVNITDPDKSDFMKFKFGDIAVDPTSGMRGTALFIRELAKIPFENKRELHGDKRMAVLGKDVASYGRGKLAPLYSTGADFFTGQDFSGNVMPYSDDEPSKHAHKLTWGEYAWSKAPLPIAEAAEVTYKSALENGADKITLNKVMKGIVSGAISGTTGFRTSEAKGTSSMDHAIDKIKEALKNTGNATDVVDKMIDNGEIRPEDANKIIKAAMKDYKNDQLKEEKKKHPYSSFESKP